ncbi:Nucleoporin [Rhizoctonia solani]|uniref:Nucleoporin n=1 Tax=Rhizoctonia solani TaxID=456999 RepID=A0A8H7ILR2_9AGAM|nr:Nucleoporin [Rhizoctonia solani]
MEVSYWDNLNTFLAKALREPTRQLEQELYYKLEDAKPRFLALLDVPPRNSGKRQNSRVAKQRSAQLDCSERHVAGILDHVLSDDPVESALRAVQQFYESRQNVLSTLQLILDSAMGMNMVEPTMRTRLVDYVIGLASTGTLAEKILKQIDTSGALMQRQMANQRNAGSTTAIGTGFSADLYAQVVSALQSERQQLGNLLFVLAGSGELRGSEVAKMVSWISTVSPDEPIMVYVLAACLAAFDASSQVASETSFVNLIKTELAKPTWKIPETKAVLTIKWCLFLIEASNGDGRTTDAYSESDIEKLVTDSVRADAFRYLSVLLHSSRPLDAVSQDTLELEYDPLPTPTPSMAFSTNTFLRRMRHADEDTSSLAASRSQAPQASPHPSRLADFFVLIALVYSDQSPDEGLKWWDDRLYSFLRWSAEARVPSLLKPLYNMFGSLARGQSCATYAYNFLSTNGGQRAGTTGWCSWAGLFGSLDWLLTSVPDQRTVDSALGGRERQPLPVDPEEIRSIMAFLRVLRVVARYSTAARAALLENTQYRAVAVMLDLVRSPVALELKGKLFDTLAAFCDGPELGGEVARLMWVSLERYEVLPVRSTTTMTTGGWKKSRGVPAELEEIEAPARTYPATLSFLHLLNALVPFPPDNLGSGHRVVGTGPYVKFVVEDVLLKIDAREYADPSERWKVTDAALEFVQRSLDGFDLATLAIGGQDAVQKLVQHPGFGVLLRVLVDSATRDVLFGILALSESNQDPYFVSSLVRTLRIISRTLEIQDLFIDLLVPSARALSLDVDIPAVVSTADQILLWRPESVVHIAGLVNYRLSREVVLLSVKLTTKLSQSTYFNSMETSALFPHRVSRLEPGEEQQSVEDQVRDAIIDFLLVNTLPTSPSPNFAHLLLGFDVSHSTTGGAMPIHDSRAIGARETCLGVVLDMVGEGIPRLDRKKTRAGKTCYRLIHNCAPLAHVRDHDPLPPDPRRLFRASAERRLDAPTERDEPDGTIRLVDNSVVATSCLALAAFLRLRSWVLDLVSLELHIMSGVEQDPRASRILSILFQKPSAGSGPGTENALTIFEEAMNVPAPGQGLMRVLELLESLAFHWTDAKAIEPVQLSLFADLNFDSCLRPDPTGCYVVDATALLNLLTQHKRNLQKQGYLPTPEHHAQLKAEMRYLLECCALENNRRCFDSLPDEHREMILFDVVQALPPVILSAAEPETAIYLCETLLSLVAKLRDDRHHQVVLQSIVDDPVAATLPPERLNALLGAIMDCVLQPGTTERQRGNLYSARCITSNLRSRLKREVHENTPSSVNRNQNSPNPSLNSPNPDWNTSAANAVVLFGSSPNPTTGRRSGLESSTLLVLNKFVDRLVPLVCRDAIDGSDVWKTIAFTFFGVAGQGVEDEKAHRSVAESEDQILAVLKPDPEFECVVCVRGQDVLAYQDCANETGADRLQDARVLSVLSSATFWMPGPKRMLIFRNLESFLPSALERYHQILVPALEIATSVVSTIAPTRRMCQAGGPLLINPFSGLVADDKQALNFILAHRETCLMLFTTERDLSPPGKRSELHLFVALCALVAPHVDSKDLNDARSFGQVHAAVLELALSEMIDANRKAKGIAHSKMSVFDRRAREATDYLHKWILVYLSAISERSIGTTESFHPVLTAVCSTAREPAAIATGKPYLADAIAALKASVARLSSLLAELKEIPTQTGRLSLMRLMRLSKLPKSHSSTILTFHNGVHLLHANWPLRRMDIRVKRRRLVYAQCERTYAQTGRDRTSTRRCRSRNSEITLELDEIQVPKDVLGATADAGARESYVHVLTRMLRTVTTLGGQDMDEEDD